MKKLFVTILFILLYGYSINSQSLNNQGAFITTSTNKSFIRVNNLDLKNNGAGNVKISVGSELNVIGNVVNAGNFDLYDSTSSTVSLDFQNSGNLNINDTAKIWVKQSVINTGHILNANLIEIGVCQ